MVGPSSPSVPTSLSEDTTPRAARGKPVLRWRFLLSPAGLWLCLVPAAVFTAIALTPLAPTDLWWHVAAGGRVLDGLGILRSDPYSFIGEGRTFQHQAWLAGTLLALLYRLGGVPLLIVANALLFTAAYLLVVDGGRRAGAGIRAAALATLLGFALSAENWALRPQSFSVLLVPLTFLILRRYADGAAPAWSLAALPALTAVWTNLHGAFVLGLLAQGLVVVGMLLERRFPSLPRSIRTDDQSAAVPRRDGVRRGEARLRPVPTPGRTQSPPPHPAAAPLILAALASAAAACLNPWGIGAYTYVLSFIRDPVHRAFSQEWAATDLTFLSGRLLLVFVIILVAALAAGRSAPRPREALLLLAFGALALSSVRNVLWFGMVAAPVLAAGLGQAAHRLPLLRRFGPLSVEGSRAGMVPLAAVVLLPILALPWLRGALPLAGDRGALLAPDTPVAVAAVLRTLEPGRRTFHDMQFGSYFIWAVYPAQQVFTDPRFEVYPYEEWSDYGRIAGGQDPGPLLDRYRIDTLALHRERQAGLIAAVTTGPLAADWQQVYEDRFTSIYRRRADHTGAFPP